ncbi:metalloprotease family M01 [Achlya hypogyna]|uniref:Metalloprotease family M01 n=1 Tax=Achlya hypogyna TaxID=1202772 RepID=A0A1V9ZKC7_ACHHY|nr:metalloprotease family M01 [Achlya hypogyna]
MATKKFRYTRHDFEPLETKPLHFDMVFDVTEKEVRVVLQTTLKYTGAEPKTVLKLNSKALEVTRVERLHKFTPLNGSRDFVSHVASFGEPAPLTYTVDTVDHFLVINLDAPVQSGDEFVILTESVARPTENILEGLYYDFTPEGCPRTIITQCQQYGFQRIVPCIDTMDAKAYYTTTIVADKNYTNMITNGDLAPGYSTPEGKPVYHEAIEVLGREDASRHVLKYHNHTVNMAPYLFFLGVGTYVTYRRTLEFPDGDTTLLELLAFPKSVEPKDAKLSVQMLHDSILWVMMSLGPEATDHCEERKAIYALLTEREALKAKAGPLCVGSEEVVAAPSELSAADKARLAEVRAELKTLLSVWTKTGYKYTGQIYREIGMENSNYGGMENVGNTTIVSSCLCPTCRMGDISYEYMERVKVHEYYHNINGSEVTGQSPFEIWLNEAVTVHMERKRHAAIFGQEYHRLGDVVRMFTPATGPLALDKAATCLSVEPEGFNQTQELVSAVTYQKAPEIVRMVELILGYKQFNVALDKYYTKYLYGNATTADWFGCMEEVSGLDLQNFSRLWLKRPDHPEVAYSTFYDADAQTYTVKMTQTGFERFDGTDVAGPWEIPIDYALITDGVAVREGVHLLKEASGELVLTGVTAKPDYLSFAREFSFFGTVKPLNMSNDSLVKQATTDPGAVNKYLAYRSVADAEKARVIEALTRGETDVVISPAFAQLHASILFAEELNPAVRALILTEKNAITSRADLSHHYDHIATATTALLQSVWSSYAEQIVAALQSLNDASVPGPHKDQLLQRALKRHLLSLVVAGSKRVVLPTIVGSEVVVDAPALALSMLDKSTFVTDKESAFHKLMEMESFAGRAEVQARIAAEWSATPEMLESYIAAISSLSVSDFATQVRTLMAQPYFNINQTHHSRTLARGLTQIRELTVLTQEGRDLMVEVFTRIGKVNQTSAYPILKCFDQIDSFSGETHATLVATLTAMQNSIDKVHEESLYNQLNIMLKKA